jgi:putative hydroxymethylpyrimidine transport system substrate-binding protein
VTAVAGGSSGGGLTKAHSCMLFALVLAASVCAGCSSSAPAGARGAAASVGAARCSSNRSAGTVTYVSPFGFDASAGIIDVFAAQRLGYFADMCLKVDIVTDSHQPYELVSSGTAQASNIGSAADDLGEVAGGANMVAVATYGDTSDYAILTRPPITSLAQLDGKSLAYHTTVPLMVLEMLRAGGADTSRIDMVESQDYDPNQLLQGREDALQAYQSNEPLTLRAEGARFNEFVPARFGIRGTFNVEVFNRGFLERHRSAATDFMRAQLHAFDYCSLHSARCVQIEEQYARGSGSEFPYEHELSVWKLELALAQDHTLPGRGVGVQSRAEWQPEASALLRYGILKSVPALSVWEDTSLVASIYRGKTLVWP